MTHMTDPKAMLGDTIKLIAEPGRGILAADESIGTATKRLESIGVESTEENRRRYREMLFTTPGLGEYINGVILFDETLRQHASDGTPFADVLTKQNMIPGIKVDKGLIPLDHTDDEKTTQGLDGLAERLQEYASLGARFAKWRHVYRISDHTPSMTAILVNAHTLGRYAAICQTNGIVPIVEPEVLIDGDHSIEHCAEKTSRVLNLVFAALKQQRICLEHIILKPSMIISGKTAKNRADIDTVAKATITVLKRCVPSAVPTINFLSGGQTPEEATAHLNRMYQLHNKNLPWNVSFSYGRALQEPALTAWAGKDENINVAQKALFKRAKLNALASVGDYDSSTE